MGAGRSYLCKTLADKLGWQYIDANLGLERYYGRRMHEIIGKQGEEAFLDKLHLERDHLYE